MKSKTFKIDSKSLTKNNIEKIKKSIDCLKETLKRSNSHLYLSPFLSSYDGILHLNMDMQIKRTFPG